MGDPTGAAGAWLDRLWTSQVNVTRHADNGDPLSPRVAQDKVARWLSWQITASDRYLTNPAPGRKTNDLLISSGVRVTFSQLPQ